MEPQVQYVEDFFIYQLDFTTAIAAAGNATGNIQIQADSDFKWIKGTYQADIAGAAQTDSSRVIPLLTVNIVDSGSGRNLMSNPVPISDLFGTGEIPFILPVARIIRARSNVAITVANYSAATAYTVRLSFIGTKIFKLG